MDAEPIARVKEVRDDGSVVELVVWRLAQPLSPCVHPYKYRLYFGADGQCRVRYDNERGKGDHLHRDGQEAPYRFRGLPLLLADFGRELQRWRQTHGHLDDRSGHP